MVFFIVMTSSISYGLITWANKYASGTMVIGYTVTQPVASAIVIKGLVFIGAYEGCKAAGRRFLEDIVDAEDPQYYEVVKACLDLPDIYTAVGAVGVFCGLMAIIYTEPKQEEEIEEDSDLEYPSFDDEGESLLELQERKGFMSESDNEFV